MAEAIGLAASIIAVVDLAAKLGGYSKFYIENVKDAKQDFRRILMETKSLVALIETLSFIVEHDPDFQDDSELVRHGLFDPSSGAVAGCEQALRRLVELIPDPICKDQESDSSFHKKAFSQRARDAATRLAWPLNKGKAMASLEEVTRFKGTISLVVLGDIS